MRSQEADILLPLLPLIANTLQMSTTSSNHPIDVFDDPFIDETTQAAWNPHDWLKQGKVYPSQNTPPVILAGRQQTLALHPEHSALLPDKHLSVTDLLQLNLPTQPSVLVTQRAKLWFHPMEPN